SLLVLRFFHILQLPPTSPLFPYTTLFRSPDDFRAQPFCQRVDAFFRAGFESHDQFVRNRFARRFGPGLPRDLDQLGGFVDRVARSEEHTSELQSRENLVCRLLLEKKNYST